MSLPHLMQRYRSRIYTSHSLFNKIPECNDVVGCGPADDKRVFGAEFALSDLLHTGGEPHLAKSHLRLHLQTCRGP